MVFAFCILYALSYGIFDVHAGLISPSLMLCNNSERSCDQTLTEIMSKLESQEEKLQKFELTVSLHSEALIERDQRITNLQMLVAGHEQALLERDQHITELQTTAFRHDALLSKTAQRISELKEALTERDVILSDRDQRIVELHKMVSEHKELLSKAAQRIAQLEKMVSEYDKTPTTIDKQLDTPDSERNGDKTDRGQRIIPVEDSDSTFNLAPRKPESVNSPQMTKNSIDQKTAVRNGDGYAYQEYMHIKYDPLIVKPSAEHKPSARVSPAVSSGVAFCASLSAPTTSLHINEAIVFDKVMTNVGDGYNHHDGIFIVPQTGVYVFTWTTVSSHHNDIGTTIQINGNIAGTLGSYGDSLNNYQSATGVIVKSVTLGDHVYIKNKMTGIIVSDNSAKSTFSGWRLF